jgi:thiopeptide-type bacteriocin biosynthesis protein
MGLSFFPPLILRCPAKPFEKSVTTPLPAELLNDTALMEAIHMASPALYEQCLKYQSGSITDPRKQQKVTNAIIKYYNRMRSRPTPFGLFSGCTVLQWGERDNIALTTDKWVRHIRFDTDFLCKLVQQLEALPEVRHQLYYRFNSSMYQVGNEYRYYEYILENNQRKYQISSVDTSPLLSALTDQCKCSAVQFDALCRQVMEMESVSHAEATAYIDEMIASQLLVSNLGFQGAGDDFLEQIIHILLQVHRDTGSDTVQRYLTGLQQMQEQLLHARCAPCLPGALKQAAHTVDALSIPFQADRLFQIDCTLESHEQTLDKQWQTPLLSALEVLRVLCSRRTSSKWLTEIKEKFSVKYDRAPVPLPYLADPDIGILLSDKTNSIAELDELQQPSSTNPAAIDREELPSSREPVQYLLMKKLLEAFKTDATTIFITDKEIAALREQVVLPPLPDTFSVMFSLINTAGAGMVIESAGGATGTSLAGRFGYTDEHIRELLQSVHAFEQDKRADTLIASVVHLPESRTGNIMQHPSIREFEIPYLGLSSRCSQHQLPVSDLYVSLQQEELTLYSKQHRKQVLPRIDNAHNYVHNTLPLYRLLGELQGEGKQTGLTFAWNIRLPGIHFFPRLQYKEVILSPAQWHLPSEAYQSLLEAPPSTRQAAFHQFVAQWKLPRLFVLSHGDQELLIDTEDAGIIPAFISEIKESTQITLKEFLYAPDNAISKDAAGRPYVHQLIGIVKNDTPVPPTVLTPDHHELPTRHFSIGSEWLYFKLYGNHHYANEILKNIISPTVGLLTDQGYINNWFFIRYGTTKEHLRVRFRLTDTQHTGEVIRQMNAALAQAEQEQYIWKVQTDTYVRELERYGNSSIVAAEHFFCADSAYVLELLRYIEAYPHHPPLLMIALKDMDTILQQFSFTPAEKTAFTGHYKDAFSKEFNPCKEEKQLFNQYFRDHHSGITTLLDPSLAATQYPELSALMQQHHGQLARDAHQLLQSRNVQSPGMQQLVGDLLHMHFNRLFHTSQRRSEMIIYHISHSYYRSLEARTKTS